MKEVVIGARRYQIVASARDGSWIAHALVPETGQRFGIECLGATEDAAIDRLAVWLEWQDAHADALKALQEAEHAYHRIVTGTAFAEGEPGASAVAQREALGAVEAFRIRLDDVRARQPRDQR
jgi:hypothetical protein